MFVSKDCDLGGKGVVAALTNGKSALFQKVRLKGQEIHHFHGQKCTDFDYTGDDGTSNCILENPSMANLEQPISATQRYGYCEIAPDRLRACGIYTLHLGPCIGILMVGIGTDQQPVKVALMHEDYSTVKLSVTNMFENSFAQELEKICHIKCYLLGGSGGEEYTADRFNIHQTEIQQLKEKQLVEIDLIYNALAKGSSDAAFERDLSHVFFSTVNSSAYLWVLQQKPFHHAIEAIQVAGDPLSNELLNAYYTENLHPLYPLHDVRLL